MKNQSERLEYLTEEFIKESASYKDLRIPEDDEGRRTILRSLMNIRMPADIDEDVLAVQDEYLQERAREKGIVCLSDIPTVKESLCSRHRHADKLSIWQGDITRIAADAIVNAANSQMLGCFIPMHTCIDNCIHSFAGIELRNECHKKMTDLRRIHGHSYQQPTAVPMLTDAYNLPSEKVIHIVGPIVSDVLSEKLKKELADCYRNTLDMCKDNGLRSVAFCCISTGVFRFPNDEAAAIAVKTVSEWLDKNSEAADRIIFNVFKDEDRSLYEELLR